MIVAHKGGHQDHLNVATLHTGRTVGKSILEGEVFVGINSWNMYAHKKCSSVAKTHNLVSNLIAAIACTKLQGLKFQM